MQITNYLKKVLFILLMGILLSSCSKIRTNHKYFEYYKSDKYFGTDRYELTQEEFAEQLDYKQNLDYYDRQENGEIYANLVKRDIKLQLQDSTLLYDLERSLDIKLNGEKLYLVYYDINENEAYKADYDRIKSARDKHPKNQYLIVFHKDYFQEKEMFNTLQKEGLMKIDAHDILENYISCPGHFEDHWISVDKNLNVHYYLGEGGYNVFLNEKDKRDLNGMRYFEEGIPISTEDFLKKKQSEAYLEVYKHYEGEELGILVFKEREGQLEFESFKKQFSNSLGIDIDYSKPLVIAFFESAEGVNDNAYKYLKRSKFENQIRQNPDINHLFILDKDYSDKEATIENTDLPVLIDRHGLLERVISKYDVRCENWITIKPDGSFYLCYGGTDTTINLQALKK